MRQVAPLMPEIVELLGEFGLRLDSTFEGGVTDR